MVDNNKINKQINKNYISLSALLKGYTEIYNIQKTRA